MSRKYIYAQCRQTAAVSPIFCLSDMSIVRQVLCSGGAWSVAKLSKTLISGQMVKSADQWPNGQKQWSVSKLSKHWSVAKVSKALIRVNWSKALITGQMIKSTYQWPNGQKHWSVAKGSKALISCQMVKSTDQWPRGQKHWSVAKRSKALSSDQGVKSSDQWPRGQKHWSVAKGSKALISGHKWSKALTLKVLTLETWHLDSLCIFTYEPAHDKTYKMACAPSKDSAQPGHPPSLISIFAVHTIGN